MPLHAALLLGTQRKVPLPERLLAYPAELAGALRWEVLREVLPQVALSGVYLLGGLLLAWGLVGGLARWKRPVLWVLEGVPSFLLLILCVWLALSFTVWRGLDFPLAPWSPVMLALFMAALALPVAARLALLSQQAYQGAMRADHSRTARSMGLPERLVRRRAARLTLAERAAGLGGDVLGVALALVILEGLLQFPGVGNSIYVALQAALSGVSAPGTGAEGTPETEWLRRQVLSSAVLLWLLLGAAASWGLGVQAARFDPRPAQAGD